MLRFVLLLLVVVFVASSTPADAHAVAAKGCAKHKVGVKRICLRAHDRCSAAFRHDYLKAHLDCHKGRLRRASLSALREGEPLLLDSHGRIDRRNALEALSSKLVRLPGVKPRPGAVGKLSDLTGVIDAVEAQRGHLTKAQRNALTRALKPTSHATAAETGQDRLDFRTIVSQVEKRLIDHGFPVTHRVLLDFPTTNTAIGHSGDDVLGYAAPGWLD